MQSVECKILPCGAKSCTKTVECKGLESARHGDSCQICSMQVFCTAWLFTETFKDLHCFGFACKGSCIPLVLLVRVAVFVLFVVSISAGRRVALAARVFSDSYFCGSFFCGGQLRRLGHHLRASLESSIERAAQVERAVKDRASV